ncbi:hypothetical protein TanjilG_19800 [Lupinus angustifolius]|uniref:Late embryogenesis abundant protein LEA-2 subgroup domain-containing protein n=1 Tax=Lupinus angustifolius TaxID=3871 RepID=A0A1J7HRZ6_LUPAN|nr:PREDICTED: uncharacterized protein LOC109356173 [Lupinus angustifolius]XP_019455056.1 PREDICTED: uncharacterized protein LOC109356174 [Lupinus angustifolius]OIW05168.1 hypothetical protein TanjilG_19799 [Lupinus angustifolius]OIW05169.1 hypothetical protein TanjilG_19800 [Lupinus angustifolius]
MDASCDESRQSNWDVPPPRQPPQAAGYHHQGYQTKPVHVTAFSNKHHEALEFDYVYHAAIPEKRKINFIMKVLYVVSVGFIILFVIAAMTLNPKTPIYHVNDLRVMNFSLNPTLKGNWYTNITVYNPNPGRFGHFHDFKLDIMHNDEVIAGVSSEGFEVEKNKHQLLEVNFTTESEIVKALKNPKMKLDELKKEHESLHVMVDIKITPVPVFMSNMKTYIEGLAVAYCPGLRIVFQKNNISEGHLNIDCQPNFCRIMILKQE